MMPFIYTQGDSSMKLRGPGLKCPEKNILNQKISFYERSLSNEVPISKQQISWHWQFKRESNEYFSPFQLITIKESFLTGSAKTPSVVILDFRALSSNN